MGPYRHSVEADEAQDSRHPEAHPVPEARHRVEPQARRAAEAVEAAVNADMSSRPHGSS
jgi:hypothetical protein